MEPITVSQITNYLKSKMDMDPNLRNFKVKGELTNVSLPKGGHIYFSIKDNQSVMKCVIFKSNAEKLKFKMENGTNVIVQGEATIYPTGGYHQIIARSVEQEDTKGDLYKQLLMIKERLEKKGYFDPSKKKQIPTDVKRIAILTSIGSAAMHDMEVTIARRNRFMEVDVYNATMQGQYAAPDIMQKLQILDRKSYDAIIVGRGGGSMEDLWAFNDEQLAELVFHMNTPIISAIGHESDVTILDFVADLRAATPTAAAEMITQMTTERLEEILKQKVQKIDQIVIRRIEREKQEVKNKKLRIERYHPKNMHNEKKMKLAHLISNINHTMSAKMEKEKQRFVKAIEKAEILNPFSVMMRGYSVVYKDEKVIKDVAQVEIHDKIKVLVSNGELDCQILNKRENTAHETSRD